MTKIILANLFFVAHLSLHAQIAYGKQSVSGNSTILDFDDSPNNTKGLILPAVTNTTNVNQPANGTFVFDQADNSVKVFYENTQGISNWVPLSENNTGSSSQIIPNASAEIGGGVIFGNPTSAPNGVLVLQSDNKAMILPKIGNPNTEVKSPYPGMMCYDTITKSLAVFDGGKWYYWN